MFQSLYNLYRKNSNTERVPLEDFNTESFAGILKCYPEIKKELVSFLRLPDDTYKVLTQVKYILPDKIQNCIIDMVLLGEKNVCFIENKVHSGEGHIQLERYGMALSRYFENFTKHLVYCTKYSDPKDKKTHNFKQIRWYEIARILERYSNSNPMISNYINFLETHKMSQDNKITTDVIITMENVFKTFEIVNYHLERAKTIASSIFIEETFKPESTLNRLVNHGRIAYLITDLFKDKSYYTELLFSFQLEEVKLQTQIFINKSHPILGELIKIIESYPELKVIPFSHGTLIFMDRKIYDLLNNSNVDEIIENWYKQSFTYFRKFIDENPQLNWDIK